MNKLTMVVVVLLSAGCAQTPIEATATSATAEPEQVCWTDTPTGTRFSQTRCRTVAQRKQDAEAGERAAEELRSIRHAPLGDPRN